MKDAPFQSKFKSAPDIHNPRTIQETLLLIQGIIGRETLLYGYLGSAKEDIGPIGFGTIIESLSLPPKINCPF